MARRRGFLAELERLGIGGVTTISVPAPSTLALGRQGMGRLLDEAGLPDAVFCGSDTLAHGALEEVRARRLHVPRDIAIIGFGGLEFTRFTAPRLSTVSVDRAAIGRTAAEALLGRIEGTMPRGKVIDVGFRIVDRGTT